MAGFRVYISGSIPACAGEPRGRTGRAAEGTVYPRLCGGTNWNSGPEPTTWGLSPLVRGNPRVRSPHLQLLRSIPACAGEPRPAARPRTPTRVYPRLCGGTQVRRDLVHRGLGLSPLVRGNHPQNPRRRDPGRSIPACAGEPMSWKPDFRRRGSIPACAGEPPLVQVDLFVEVVYPRLCGEPGAARNADGLARVYPRLCGGTADISFSLEPGQGLSPLVRGNLPASPASPASIGSIPACAGEPGWRRRRQ